MRGGGDAAAGAASGGAGSWRVVRNRKSPRRAIQRTEFKPEAKDTNEKNFMDIRGLLNKVTRSNVDSITEKILDSFRALDEKWQMRVFKTIHDNVSKQVIFIDQYRQILEALISLSPEIRRALQNFWAHFATIYEIQKKIEEVDYREDYDAFCDLNDMKARRKGLSEFFGICMTSGLGDHET